MATKAISLAELFRFVVGPERIAGAPPYRAELAAPEGESTGGGKQAVQHVNLVPDGAEGTVIVAGAANQVAQTAELRSHARLAEIHAQRFKGARLPFEVAAYGPVLVKMQAFFQQQGLRVSLADAGTSPSGSASAPAAPAARLPLAWMIVGLLLFAAVGAVVALLLARR